MNLGKFFTTAPFGRPVDPRPVTFTAIAKGPVLPGGARNPNYPAPMAAKVTGAFVFVGGDEIAEIRLAARDHVRKACSDADGILKRTFTEDDVALEINYQVIARAIRQWDPKTKQLGSDPLFANLAVAREHVVAREAQRVAELYDKYVDDEHPEVVDDATFRKAAPASEGVARGGAG